MGKKKNNRSFLRKLIDPYRLIIIDEETFEQKVDFSLSRLNVFVFLGGLSVFLIGITVVLIATTPLREYIPGYPSAAFKRQIYRLHTELDSLRREIEIRNTYLTHLRLVMTGEIEPEALEEAVAHDSVPEVKVDTAALQPSQADLALRKEIEQKEKFVTDVPSDESFGFLSPLRGIISQGFDPAQRHFGTDIVVKTKTPVKAIATGTVIFSDWTPDNGKVIIIQHQAPWISVYKHNQKLLKRKGERVKAGEVIAISGDVGTNSTGPHLHFELWNNGTPVNPENYIDFSVR